MVADEKVLLGPPMTGDYTPSAQTGSFFAIRKAPPFSLTIVSEMLTDPRVSFGLRLIKGPILSKAKFKIDCKNDDVRAYCESVISRFWRSHAESAMRCFDWGYSCSEVLYKVEDGLITFDATKDIASLDARALTVGGDLVGARVRCNGLGANRKRVDLPKMKTLWTVHERDLHRWYGRSRIYGAYLPWLECWCEGGYRDSRRLFFHKNAFDCGGMYHPTGTSNVMTPDGQLAAVVPNKDLARDIVEKRRNGAVVTIPGTRDETGNHVWELIGPTVSPAPAGLMEHGQDLKDEIWEGMGVPPEVAKAEGTGAYAGRRVPQAAFYSTLQRDLNWIIYDFTEQVMRPLVRLNYGDVSFEIIPSGLLTDTEEGEGQGQDDQQGAEPIVADEAGGGEDEGQA